MRKNLKRIWIYLLWSKLHSTNHEMQKALLSPRHHIKSVGKCRFFNQHSNNWNKFNLYYFYIPVPINNPVIDCGHSVLRYILLSRFTITLVMNSVQHVFNFFPLTLRTCEVAQSSQSRYGLACLKFMHSHSAHRNEWTHVSMKSSQEERNEHVLKVWK